MAESDIMYLIVGRSGAGKSKLESELESLGLKPVTSYATRPKRTAHERGHMFVTDEEADALEGEAVAETTIGGYRYFATKGQVEDADMYVIDPKGVRDITTAMPDKLFHVIYVSANTEARRARAIARADDQAAAAKAFDEREEAEGPEFDEFEHALETLDMPMPVAARHLVRNDYQPQSMTEKAMAIAADRQRHKNLVAIVDAAIDEGIVGTDERGWIRVAFEDGTHGSVPRGRFASVLGQDADAFKHIMDWWLSNADVRCFVVDRKEDAARDDTDGIKRDMTGDGSDDTPLVIDEDESGEDDQKRDGDHHD